VSGFGKTPQVIVIKKAPHARHKPHGGAWKVAYADFVTAMMAFFLVMWLVNTSPDVRAAVAAYFRDPGVFETGRVQQLLPEGAQTLAPPVMDPSSGPPEAAPRDVEAARAALERAAEKLRAALRMLPAFKLLEDRIEIQVTHEGLRIELLESDEKSFFELGSAELRPETRAVLATISTELSTLPNPVAIEGHTDSRAYDEASRYANWELSSDRANAARRWMQTSGLRSGQLEAVHGYADTRLRVPGNPLDARNRRVSILVRQLLPAARSADGRFEKSGD
jgi:chemotaxis protein MotB